MDDSLDSPDFELAVKDSQKIEIAHIALSCTLAVLILCNFNDLYKNHFQKSNLFKDSDFYPIEKRQVLIEGTLALDYPIIIYSEKDGWCTFMKGIYKVKQIGGESN